MSGNHRNAVIAPRETLERMRRGTLAIIDVRERHEQLTGMASGSHSSAGRSLPETLAEVLAEQSGVDSIALICERGNRSARACAALDEQCRVPLLSVQGGMQAWAAQDLPVTLPPSELSLSERRRYLRHLALADIGEAGQLRLKRARVLVVGAGGLGSPCAMYLAAAGIGQLDIVDADTVELSNLQRQLLHAERQVGDPKADSARARLAGINSDIEIRAHRCRLQRDNVEELLQPCSLVIDGSDNFPTRYLINDACIRLGRTMVYGAIERFTGQLGVFRPGDGVQPCYRCLFPRPPAPEDAPDCAQAGVLGVLPGVIGTLQAVEALKLVLGIGTALTGSLLHYDALASAFRHTRVARDPACRWCDPARSIDHYPDYEDFCATT